MVSITKLNNVNGRIGLSLVALSTDSKPTTYVDGFKVTNGSELAEMDTGKVYLFDETNLKWREF